MTNILHIQPALPRYRLDFFERLDRYYAPGFSVVYSPESLPAAARPRDTDWAVPVGPMRRLPGGLLWQSGVSGLPIGRGDIVVLSGNPRRLSTLALLARARLRGARVVWWGHYWSSSSKNWRMALRLMLMRLAHGVVFYTDREVAEYRAGPGRGDIRPVVGLNNGIDTVPMCKLRAPYIAQQRRRELLFVGRQTKKANLSLLIRALATTELSDCHLHVVGEGEESAYSRATAEASGVLGRITWHGVSTDETVIAPIANRCRLFVYPGEVGLSLIHGMAYGLPCVVHSNRWQHMPEIAAFEEGHTGRSFAPNNIAALVSVVASLKDDENALDQMSQRCLDVISAGFNTKNMAARFISLIELLN